MKHINLALFVPDEGCPHRCSFCNQKTISGSTKKLTAQDVHDAVKIALNGNFESQNGEIAFFGGSFTAIEREYMISLLSAAKEYIDKGCFKGIRISTRPDCIDEQVLDVLSFYGVTSIELGCQSMSDRVLSLNERGHTAKDVVESAKLIKERGFELGVQMMTGLYGDDDETAVETAKKLIELKPDTARIYPTIVLENTTLALLYERGIYKAQTLSEAVSLCSKLLLMFDQANVRVIRLGLHSGGNVEDGYIAGAYHPAFREKCESEIYFQKIRFYLEENKIEKGNLLVTIGSKYVSQFVGQSKENIKKLESLGYKIKIAQDKETEKYEFKVQSL